MVESQIFDTSSSFANAVDIDTDDDGLWAVVWQSGDSLGGTVNTDVDIMISTSEDVGASWSAARLLDSRAANQSGQDVRPTIAAGDADRWYAAWGQVGTASLAGGGVGSDADIVISRSLDGTTTWTAPALLNANGLRDRSFDVGPELFSDGAGNWLVYWVSDETLGGTIGEDFDFLFATASELCPEDPMDGCLGTVDTGRSRVFLKDEAGGRDLLKWKWRGQETTGADVGAPNVSADYIACVYDDSSGGASLVSEHHMLAATLCKSRPCWKATSKGYRYKDGKREHGPVRTVTIQTGADGDAKIGYSAKGAGLAPPLLPFEVSPSVTFQLMNVETGRCWEAVYSSPDSNDAEEFRARSD